eukprot:scaffold6420_cov168-Amphora_coffeaeformis.AAC.22
MPSGFSLLVRGPQESIEAIGCLSGRLSGAFSGGWLDELLLLMRPKDVSKHSANGKEYYS